MKQSSRHRSRRIQQELFVDVQEQEQVLVLEGRPGKPCRQRVDLPHIAGANCPMEWGMVGRAWCHRKDGESPPGESSPVA